MRNLLLHTTDALRDQTREKMSPPKSNVCQLISNHAFQVNKWKQEMAGIEQTKVQYMQMLVTPTFIIQLRFVEFK